jgi:hypothetical protein
MNAFKNIGRQQLLWFICITVMLGQFTSGFSATANSIAVVVKASGEVTIQTAAGSADEALKQGMRLNDGDRIFTGEEGRAVMVYTDDRSQLKMLPNTELVIHARRTNERVDKEVALDLGTIWTKVTRQKGEFVISTPTSVASVKGTAWWTKLDGAGQTTIVTEEGRVGLKNLNTGDEIDVPMGSTGESYDEKLVVHDTIPDDVDDLERGELIRIELPITDGDQSRTLIIEYYE